MKEEIEDTENQSRMSNIQLRGVQEGRDRTMKMGNLGKAFGRISKLEEKHNLHWKQLTNRDQDEKEKTVVYTTSHIKE